MYVAQRKDAIPMCMCARCEDKALIILRPIIGYWEDKALIILRPITGYWDRREDPPYLRLLNGTRNSRPLVASVAPGCLWHVVVLRRPVQNQTTTDKLISATVKNLSACKLRKYPRHLSGLSCSEVGSSYCFKSQAGARKFV